MSDHVLERSLVSSIVKAFYAVYNYYGFGLLESVYAAALEYELADHGHKVARELAVQIMYKGRHAAWQRLDMLVDDKVIVECKATEVRAPLAQRQLVNYLRATPYQVGVLLHFGPEPRFERFVDTKSKTLAGAPRPGTHRGH